MGRNVPCNHLYIITFGWKPIHGSCLTTLRHDYINRLMSARYPASTNDLVGVQKTTDKHRVRLTSFHVLTRRCGFRKMTSISQQRKIAPRAQKDVSNIIFSERSDDGFALFFAFPLCAFRAQHMLQAALAPSTGCCCYSARSWIWFD